MDRRLFIRAAAAGAILPGRALASETWRKPLDVGESRVRLNVHPGELAVSRETLVAWVQDSCDAVASWYGGFPVHPMELEVRPRPGRGVFGGVAFGGTTPRVRVSVGASTTRDGLYGDWTLVHELVHMAFPQVPGRHHWIEEGLSTYVEPWVRVAVGHLDVRKAWRDLVTGLPQGQPRAGDRGLDHTPTWGRTYWGGALYCLVADVEIRRRTGNVRGLRDALVGIVKAGGSMHHHWPLERALDAGDAATGTTAMRDTWSRMAATPVTVDLAALWAELGVARVGAEVVFDDTAPGAAMRRAIDGTA